MNSPSSGAISKNRSNSQPSLDKKLSKKKPRFKKRHAQQTNKISEKPLRFQKENTQRGNSNARFPYKRDLINFGQEYISMCLETGNDYIYSFDSDTSHLMKFGIDLIFTAKPDMICLSCDYRFPKESFYLYEHLQDEVHLQNLKDLEESSKEFESHKNQLSYLDLAKSCMQEKSEAKVECVACEVTVPNSDDEIKIHMNSEIHISELSFWRHKTQCTKELFCLIQRDSWYYANQYFCYMCDLLFNREISFAKHLYSEHLIEIKLEEQNKINICYACSSCWFGPCDYSKHYEDYMHKNYFRKIGSVYPKMNKAAKDLLNLNSLDKRILNLIEKSNKLTSSQKNKEKELLESIEDTVKPVYPNAKAYIFGSRLSNLGFPTSDVDVFLDCENIYYNIGSKEESQKHIKAIEKHFSIPKNKVWKKVIALLKPRVPIIKLEHIKTDLKCDISFISGISVEKSTLLKNYVVAYQHCRELILFLKKWLEASDLHGSTAIQSYAISWYAIFYLQTKGILPSVNQLMNQKKNSKIVDGWQCDFSELIPVTLNNYSFRDLLVGFFFYYAKFNYQTSVVCPLLGKAILKSTFVRIDDLPEEMEIYKNRLEKEEIELFHFDSPMCIQDPVDLSQNITKAVTKIQLRTFRYFCMESFGELTKEN